MFRNLEFLIFTHAHMPTDLDETGRVPLYWLDLCQVEWWTFSMHTYYVFCLQIGWWVPDSTNCRAQCVYAAYGICVKPLFQQAFMGQNIRIYHECEGRIEKSVWRIAVWHHEACRVMTSGDPEGQIFYPTLTRIMDSFSCSPLFFYLKISFQKSLNTLRCNFTWWRHLNITITSLDDNVREFQYNQWPDSLDKVAWVR